jgi:hypothetical protein
MTRAKQIISLGVLLLLSATAGADVYAFSGEKVSQNVISHESPRVICDLLGGGIVADLAIPRDEAPSAVPSETSPVLAVVDGGPQSSTLFLTALGGLAAVHVGRSAKKIHIGQIPEYLHSGGPMQIGHSLAADLESVNVLALRTLDGSAIAPFHILLSYLRGQTPEPLRLTSQTLLETEAPRGPPACF